MTSALGRQTARDRERERREDRRGGNHTVEKNKT